MYFYKLFSLLIFFFFFFFNDTATTEIYTLSLHDALPISKSLSDFGPHGELARALASAVTRRTDAGGHLQADRKSTRLNSSHGYISYAVFCLKKKKNKSSVIDLRECKCDVTQKEMQTSASL